MDNQKNIDKLFLMSVFSVYNEKDIRQLAKKLSLSGLRGLKKKEIDEKIIDYLLLDETMKVFLEGMTSQEVDLFLAVRGQDMIAVDPDELVLFSYFLDNGYGGITSNYEVMLARSLYLCYDSLEEREYNRIQKEKERVNIYSYVANLLYGITPLSQLLKIYNHYEKKKISHARLDRLLKETVPYRQGMVYKNEELLDSRLLDKKKRQTVMEQQVDKSFYMPTMSVINELTNSDYYAPDRKMEQFVALLERHAPEDAENYDAEGIAYEVRSMMMFGCEFREIMSMLLEQGTVITNEAHMVEFGQLLMELWNHTRMIGNRGHSPVEMAKKMGQEIPKEANNSSSGKIAEMPTEMKEQVYHKRSANKVSSVIDLSQERERRRNR